MTAFTNISNTETLDMIKTSIGTIKKYMTDDKLIKEVDRYQQLFLEGSQKRLGLTEKEGDSADDKKLRGTVIGAIAAVNSNLEKPITEVDEQLKEKLAEFLKNPNDSKISNDLKPAVVFFGLNNLEDETELQKQFQL